MCRALAITLIALSSALGQGGDPAWLAPGDALLRGGRPLEAAKAFDGAAEAHPEDWRGWHRAGTAYGRARRFSLAIDRLERALSCRDDEAIIHFDLATSHFNHGAYEASLPYWERLQSDERFRDLPLRQRGLIAYFRALSAEKLERTAEAIAAFERAVSLEPENPDFRRRFGVILFNEGRYEAARLQFQEVKRLDPDPDAHYFYGISAIECGDRETGRAELERACSLDGRHDRAWLKLGRLHFGNRDYRRAEACLRVAVEVNPLSFEAFKSLALVAKRLGQDEQAAEYNAEYERLVAESRRIEAELRAFKLKLVQDPKDLEARQGIVNIFLRHRRFEEATAALQQLLALNPANHLARINLAQVLATLEKHDAALFEHGFVLEQDPQHPIAHLERGRILAHLNRHREALPSLSQATALLPADDSRLVLAAELLLRSALAARAAEGALPWLRAASDRHQGTRRDHLKLLTLVGNAAAVARAQRPEYPLSDLELALSELERGDPLRRHILETLVLMARSLNDSGRLLQYTEALRAEPTADLENP